MRIEIINHLEDTEILATIGESEKQAILDEIDDIQRLSKDELFHLHRAQKEGKLVLSNEYLETLLNDIDKFSAKLDIVEIEFQREKII